MSTSGVVTFNPVIFQEIYPEFASLTTNQLQYAFNRAQLQLNNTPSSRVQDVGERTILLNLLTAHIACINYGVNGQAPSPLVGQLNSASEDSVSVGVQAELTQENQYYLQTKYGIEYWQATAKYRTMKYVPGRSVPAPGPNLWLRGPNWPYMN